MSNASVPPETMPSTSQPTPAASKRRLPAEIGVAVVCAAIFLYFSLQSPTFRSPENLRLLAKQSTQLALLSTGMTLVISTGGIDISVGSLIAFCAMTLGWLSVRAGMPILPACLLAVLTGAAFGLVNGLLIARAKFPPIIVTLATLAAARAGAMLFNDGNSISPLPLALNDLFDRTQIAGLPLLFWISVISLVAGHLLLNTTRFGRELLALGGNRTAAQLSGMPIIRTETLVYLLSGLLAGVAAVIDVSLKTTATPNAGKQFELYAITAVVLGGTAITGGQATMLGTALGVVAIRILLSGVRLSGGQDEVAWFMVGVALLLAVEVQKWRGKSRG